MLLPWYLCSIRDRDRWYHVFDIGRYNEDDQKQSLLQNEPNLKQNPTYPSSFQPKLCRRHLSLDHYQVQYRHEIECLDCFAVKFDELNADIQELLKDIREDFVPPDKPKATQFGKNFAKNYQKTQKNAFT